MKKILFIVEAMGGGVFTYIVDLANELVNEYDMYIAYSVRKQTPENYRDYFDKRIKLIEVENFERSINPIKDIRAFFEIKKIAKRVNPDFIHLHSSKAGALGRIAFNGKNVPLFYTPHGYSFLMQNHSVVKRMIYKFVEVVCTMRNCMTISCSEGEHQETLKLTRNATYVNNGINVKELQKVVDENGEVNSHPFTVFTLGRICYQKNPRLFNKVAESLPDVKFLWIGDGELRDELKSPNIEVTGWVKREDAIRFSLKGDVFILTSLWEGLPMSLLESMYLNKLCVVNNVIGSRNVIRNKENGFVCNSIDDFVIAIRESGNHQDFIDKAYYDVLKKFNTEVMAEKYCKIYQAKIAVGGAQHNVIVYTYGYTELYFREINHKAAPELGVAA